MPCRAEGVEWGEDYLAGLGPVRGPAAPRLINAATSLRIFEATELVLPRTRAFSAPRVVPAYTRRAWDIERMMLACFVLELSTRKLAAALLPILGGPGSPATESAVA